MKCAKGTKNKIKSLIYMAAAWHERTESNNREFYRIWSDFKSQDYQSIILLVLSYWFLVDGILIPDIAVTKDLT